jgi:hypothetical protein
MRNLDLAKNGARPQNVIAHRGGQFFVRQFIWTKSISLRQATAHTGDRTAALSVRQEHSGKKIFKIFFRRTFWLKP